MTRKAPKKYIGSNWKTVADMKPGEIGWVYERNLAVDCDEIMFIHSNTSVLPEKQTGENQVVFLGIHTSPLQPTNVKIERLPDGTFAVCLHDTFYTWQRTFQKYIAWKTSIPLTVLEQT